MRAALQQLEAEGLAERVPRRGLLVATITSDEARQIYEIRAALEPVMARRFVERASPDEMAMLIAAADRIEQTQAAPAEYVRAFATFYDVMLQGSGNQVAQRILHMLTARVSYLRSFSTLRGKPGRQAQTVALLREIAQAAEARDGARVATLSEAFVLRSASFTATLLTGATAPGALPQD